MTSGLRKAHKLIWLFLIIVIPIIMFFSVKNLDFYAQQESNSIPSELDSYENFETDKNDILNAVISRTEDSIVVTLEIKTPLKAPSAEVYEIDENGKKSLYLGQLSIVKTYNFNVSSEATGILIYDALKDTEITKLIF